MSSVGTSQSLVEQCQRIEEVASQLWTKYGGTAERKANFTTGKKTCVRSGLSDWFRKFDERILVLSQFDELPFYKIEINLFNSPPAAARGRVRIMLFHSRSCQDPDNVTINFVSESFYKTEYYATSPSTKRPENSLEYFSRYIEWVLPEMEMWLNKE